MELAFQRILTEIYHIVSKKVRVRAPTFPQYNGSARSGGDDAKCRERCGISKRVQSPRGVVEPPTALCRFTLLPESRPCPRVLLRLFGCSFWLLGTDVGGQSD